MLLNVGPTRADGLPGVEKIDIPSGAVMRHVAREVMLVLVYPHFQQVLIFFFSQRYSRKNGPCHHRNVGERH